jgi:hypothetical protein
VRQVVAGLVLLRRRERLARHQRAFGAVVAVGHHADPHSPAVDVESLARQIATLRMIALSGGQADLRLRHRRTHEAQGRNRAHVGQRIDRHATAHGTAVDRRVEHPFATNSVRNALTSPSAYALTAT